MKRGSVFRIPHIQEVYPMPYSTFCISHIETWDLDKTSLINKKYNHYGLTNQYIYLNTDITVTIYNRDLFKIHLISVP